MHMQQSRERILTTHCGSLARPSNLLDLMKLKVNGQPYDRDTYTERVQNAVTEIVRKQVETGIDIVTDGEQSKPGFFTYVNERLTGFAPKTGARFSMFADEVAAFPEYYEEYFRQAMLGGSVASVVPMACTGPVTYKGQEALQQDIDNLKTALAGANPTAVFMPAVAPSGVGTNEYYRTEEEYLYAVAGALRTEYQAIVDAGFLVQIDDPFLTDVYSDSSLNGTEKHQKAELFVAALNHALRGIPAEKVRFHTCYGINEGPRVYDAQLKDVLGTMLKVNAGAYSFEAANARHEHEYHLWETVKLSEGKAIIPGVITHASNIVEHPEFIAERIVRYAKLVGRERVIAGADCGFSSQATYHPEVHPTVVWAKFRAMAEGARLATKQLWG
jgi:5-methyltetrahydropteroyltriglutamate--homocysteine methyltransferase